MNRDILLFRRGIRPRDLRSAGGKAERPLFLALLVVSFSQTSADLDRGMTYFKAGKHVEAAAEFQSLVDHSNGYDYGFFMLGNCFLKLGRLDEAEKSFRKALELKAARFEYHHGLASAYLAQRRYAEALQVLAAAETLVDDGSRYAFHSLRGFALAAQENWRDAVTDLERSAALKVSPPVLNQLAKAYFGLGASDKAAQALRQSLTLAPSDPQAWTLLAETLLDQAAAAAGEEDKRSLYVEALRAAQRFQSTGAPGFEGANLVGRAALGAGDIPLAEEALRQVLSAKPDHCYAMINLAKCAIAVEKWKDAEARLTEASRCAPKLAVVPETLAFVYLKENRLRDSLEACRRADALQSTPATQRCVRDAGARLEQGGHRGE